MCEGHYDILTDEGPRGDTVFIPAEGPELDALVEKVASEMYRITDLDHTYELARAAIEAMRGK